MNEEKILNKAADTINKTKAEKPIQDKLLVKWKKFVEKNDLALSRDGKTYLRVEAWNFLFAQRGLSPSIIDLKTQTNSVTDDSGNESVEIIYIAKAGLIPLSKDIPEEGVPIGPISYAACRVGENEYCSESYSAISMAQTRAIGKLGRSVFGHLAIACGFQATPWEEMPKK